MAVFIQDTARNTLIRWSTNAIQSGYARGAYLSPFTSPLANNGFKKSALETAKALSDAGGEFWFDPMTYALDMPRAGDFRHYSGWPLWPGERGALQDRASMEGHVKAVFSIQDELGSPKLAPTVLVSYPDTPKSQQALHLSEVAAELDPNAWLTIAGDPQFWAAGAELDAHIGALDQLIPAGWLLVASRSDTSMPPAITAEEVFGMMRTTYALSQARPVRIAFGDVAALPAIAAGGGGLGTGWDMRQRICAYQDFEERPADQAGGAWYQRPTLRGLLGGLSNSEYDVLKSERSSLATQLTPGDIAPQPEAAFRHHAKVLTNEITDLMALSGRARVERLRDRYAEAAKRWPEVQRVTGARLGPKQWITPFAEGVDLFITDEGWA